VKPAAAPPNVIYAIAPTKSQNAIPVETGIPDFQGTLVPRWSLPSKALIGGGEDMYSCISLQSSATFGQMVYPKNRYSAIKFTAASAVSAALFDT
jgi:hypothetical protein